MEIYSFLTVALFLMLASLGLLTFTSLMMRVNDLNPLSPVWVFLYLAGLVVAVYSSVTSAPVFSVPFWGVLATSLAIAAMLVVLVQISRVILNNYR